MHSNHATICRTANKIAVQMEYLQGTSDSKQARKLALDSIIATKEGLNELDPSQLRSWCERLESVFNKHRRDLAPDPDQWKAFVGRQCDAFSEVGLHQKTILSIGNVFSDWNCEADSFGEFTSSLDCLDNLVSQQADTLTSVLIAEPEPASPSHAAIFALMHNALAVVMTGIVNACDNPDSKKIEESHVTMFGMTLFNHCVDSISQQVVAKAVG